MCYSESVSWASLGVAWTGCAVLAMRPQAHWRVLAGALAVVGGMQLWDALLWRQQHDCTSTNAALSKAAALNNHVEPVVYWLLAAWLLSPRSPCRAQAASIALQVYIAVFMVLTAWFWMLPADQQCTRIGNDGGLVWAWNRMRGSTGVYALFLVSLVLTTYAYMPAGIDHAITAAILVSFGTSYVQYRGKGEIGRMWCFYAAFLPWLAVVVTSLKFL